ncbi:COX15/CtaA family protein [Candidatus Aalborgicola defluviihabitans]|uniref:COX15/CtaA family protein n=1 Tax=Candidatus Aalborgicola defluviihabitans TaxID=3386187 RepID=UPI001D90E68B|nr:COX15/CtaA family protein [Burkholderiales bacterium]MBK7315653.1 COX15/CtaA family protein [Burkholderiales bacterium]
MHATLYDFSPVVRMLLMGLLLASGPLLMVYLRNRRSTPLWRMHALTLVTLFLTFDLVLFGAFTRLTDSGLGCPDWPGCYGNASPLGASVDIAAAQQVMPTGPVTPGKAWVEMVHRYLAMGVGVLITVLAIAAWLGRKSKDGRAVMNPWWAAATLVWVCIQGAFGALTVTMKLFPAIVTLHLLGGYVLLALLTVQSVMLAQQQGVGPPISTVSVRLRLAVFLALALLTLQAASGAWVSTNYAVLACTEFPQCQGSWWPQMDFSHGFEIWRHLGFGQDGEHISFQSLTAIHFAHRLLAMFTLVLLALLAAHLRSVPGLRKLARNLAVLLLLQLATGLSNVVLDWPLVAAVLHTGGAGALIVVLVQALVSTRVQRVGQAHLANSTGLNA